MLPTAEEYFEKRYDELGIKHVDQLNGEDELVAIEFAKMHVQAALEAAAQSAIAKENSADYGTGEIWVDAGSILHSYPLSNIK